jgi:hypothetical protein
LRSFVVGGPYYQSRLDVRTAMTIQQLIGWAPRHGWQPLGMIAEDTMLDLARNLLLDKAIAMGADWLISIDSDISLKNPQAVFASLALENDNRIAVVGFPARCGNGRWNVVLDGQTIAEPLGRRRDVERIGTGAIAFRLGWYVKNWWKDETPFFQTVSMRSKETGKIYNVGEDYGHCNAVRSLGGRVVADPNVRVIHHTARIGSPAARAEEESA